MSIFSDKKTLHGNARKYAADETRKILNPIVSMVHFQEKVLDEAVPQILNGKCGNIQYIHVPESELEDFVEVIGQYAAKKSVPFYRLNGGPCCHLSDAAGIIQSVIPSSGILFFSNVLEFKKATANIESYRLLLTHWKEGVIDVEKVLGIHGAEQYIRPKGNKTLSAGNYLVLLSDSESLDEEIATETGAALYGSLIEPFDPENYSFDDMKSIADANEDIAQVIYSHRCLQY